MITIQTPSENIIRCPGCDSEAIYRYGKIKTGKQRFLCLICNRQFIINPKKQKVAGKPLCPECGKSMYLYKIEDKIIKFRCSDYPACKTFKKFIIKEEKDELLHS